MALYSYGQVLVGFSSALHSYGSKQLWPYLVMARCWSDSRRPYIVMALNSYGPVHSYGQVLVGFSFYIVMALNSYGPT